MTTLVIKHADGSILYEGEPLQPSVPIDKLSVDGRATWLWLHAKAAAGELTQESITWWIATMVPRYGCSCVAKSQELLAKIPFRTDDQFPWSVDFHNGVNAQLPGKRQWTVEEARAALPTSSVQPV